MEAINTLIAACPQAAVPIVICVCLCWVLYLKIGKDRKQTKEVRDSQHDDLQTRITLLEADNKLLHSQLDTIGNKLDKIIDQLCEIKVELAKKEDKE